MMSIVTNGGRLLLQARARSKVASITGLSVATAAFIALSCWTDPAGAQVSAPPHGNNVPIASQRLAQTTPAPAPADANAPQASDAVDVPQVSPVEQFELDGNFRIAPVSRSGEALNSQAAGTIRMARVTPQSSSSQWSFEAVPNSPYVRIRNDWKNNYLADDNGKPAATTADASDEASHWTFEPVDGTSYIQFRNRATERFLMIRNGAPVLVDDYDQNQEKLAFWNVTPAKEPLTVAAPAVSPAYAAALADCRSIGGMWTGASCRAIHAAQPLACRRGWAWDPVFDECVWNGPSACPPWQVSRGGRCFADLTCRGGRLRPTPRGLMCQCPAGMAVWGNYPTLSCKPALARILPLFVPVIANPRRPGANQQGNNRRPGGGQNAVRNPNRPSLGGVNRIPFGQRAAIPPRAVNQPAVQQRPVVSRPQNPARVIAPAPVVQGQQRRNSQAPGQRTPQQGAGQRLRVKPKPCVLPKKLINGICR